MKQSIFKSPTQIPTRKNTLILVLLILTLAPFIAISAENQNTAPASADSPTHPHHHTIFVTGIGEISAAPNQAVVRFGMTAQNSRAAVAQSKVNEVIQKATAAIVKAGVQRHFIHTARLSLTPVYGD